MRNVSWRSNRKTGSGLTKQFQTLFIILVNDLYSDNEVECSPEMLDSGDIDCFWSDQADGLKVDVPG